MDKFEFTVAQSCQKMEINQILPKKWAAWQFRVAAYMTSCIMPANQVKKLQTIQTVNADMCAHISSIAGASTLLDIALTIGCTTVARADAVHNAAVNGHLECIKIANTHECLQSIPVHIVRRFSDRGLGVMQARAQNLLLCRDAAQGGHLHILKWARSQTPPIPWDFACSSAARNGHLETLKWLRAQNPPCPWNAFTCSSATFGGHLEVLKWLRMQDPPCPWDEETCGCASHIGRLDILKWLKMQDPPCPWDEEVYIGGYVDVINWARQNGCPEY